MSVDGKIMIRIAFLIIFLASMNGASAVVKMWIVNTDVTIGSRYWDTLVTIGKFSFNGSMTNAYALPNVLSSSTESCELLYPLDKLSPDLIDQSNQTFEGSCVDEELLTKIDRVFWIDPRNWNGPSSDGNKAVPHVEQIPCDYDRIRIPNTTSTFIILPPKPITVTGLRFGRTTFYSYTVKKYMKNEYFTRHFIVKSSLSVVDIFNISSSGCLDKTGCECGTSDYQEEVCAFVENNCTEDWACEKPIKPRGHCCSICSVVLSAFFDEKTFVYNKVQPIVQKFIENQAKEMNLKVSWYMSKVSRSMVQVIVVPEEEYSVDILDMVNGLDLYLENTSNLGIQVCWVEDSGKAIGGQRGWSTMIKIFMGLVVVLIGGIVLVYVKKSEFFKTLPFFNGLNYKQRIEDKNELDISRTTKTETEINNTEDEKVVETEPSTQHEQAADLIDTTG